MICWDRVGCDTCSASAARVKLWFSATERRYRIERGNISFECITNSYSGDRKIVLDKVAVIPQNLTINDFPVSLLGCMTGNDTTKGRLLMAIRNLNAEFEKL